MNSRQYVSQFEKLFKKGKSLSPAKIFKAARPKIPVNAPTALLFSPHPDDECITGALPLRLLREAKWKVVNVAVTLGSKLARRNARSRELKSACAFLGFDLAVGGLEKINLESRKKNRAQWKVAIKAIVKTLAAQKPQAIFIPHKNDLHPTHVGTHFLVLDALKTLPKDFKCHVVETEFWGQMASPNLLVESSVEDVGELATALSLHVGEVRRNPYHARLPAWMMDNVRRGAELVGGQDRAAPDFIFGTIYNLQKWRGGKLEKVLNGESFLGASKNPAHLFR